MTDIDFGYDNEDKVGYKIEAGREYKVFRTDFNNYTFYKIGVTGKNYDGTKKQAYKSVSFRKGVDLKNGSTIKIIKGFEDFRENPKDQYNAIWSVFILDYEMVEEGEAPSPYEQFAQDKQTTPYDFENSVELDDNSLPF